jgi:hypothetical protein
MAVITPTAKAQFIDAAGIPLAGGFVYTYAAGTTTPQTTYTDSTGATANSNPIVLDSRGEANIWLGSATYKFKLTDSNGTEIWTVDNISAPTSGLSPVLSGNVTIDSNTAGTALTITQTGTGLALKIEDTSSDPTPFVVDATGQVGIGTISPATALDVNDGTIQLSSSGTSRATLAADASNTTLSSVGARGLILAANSANLVYGTSSGFVGIKNASPTVELDITGAIKTSGAATIGGNTAVTGTLSATGNISTSAGNITATAGSITAGTSITATTSASVGTTLSVDTIAEKTSNAGVTVDGVLLKDGVTAASSIIITSGTPLATTSGSSVEFTGIPTWAKKITVMFYGISVDTTNGIYVQIGPSGGVTTTGYTSTSIRGSGSPGSAAQTSGFAIQGGGNAGNTWYGMMDIFLMDATNYYYVSTHSLYSNNSNAVYGGGGVATTGLITRVKLVGDATNFDAGSVNILYE